MRRLGIFVFFDMDGIVDDYIDYLLIEYGKVCEDIYIVINGIIRQSDLIRLRRYATDIFIRENHGFDAGAYKDVFLKFIPYQTWKEYDEVVLMNDSVFGPVFPLEILWDNLKAKDIDFWGLTRHPKKGLCNGKVVDSHIQSYFLVIRKRMLISSHFWKFWEDLHYPREYQDAIDNFELKFTEYFEKRGFRNKTLMDDLDLQCEENPYLYYSYELVCNNILPFLKKKCFTFERSSYENVLDALAYIECNSEYDSNLIWDNICRLCKTSRYDSILNYNELEIFYQNHKRIFIYGAGKYGRRLQRYFECRKWEFQKFLVSNNDEDIQNCSNFAEEHINEKDGVILGLGKNSTREVLEKISQDLKPEQIFTFQYDRGRFNEDNNLCNGTNL